MSLNDDTIRSIQEGSGAVRFRGQLSGIRESLRGIIKDLRRCAAQNTQDGRSDAQARAVANEQKRMIKILTRLIQ